MSTLLLRQRVGAELASLEQLLQQARPNDVLGRIGLESRINALRHELEGFDENAPTRAEIALVFTGRPVVGSSAIQAPFTTRALDVFQRAVTTSFALQGEGQVGQRGPVAAADLAALHITGLVHGSFGFVLEELDPSGPQFIDSALKQAADSVVALIEHLSSEDAAKAQTALEEANARLFVNVRDLVKLVHEHDAGLSIALPERVTDLSGLFLKRAYDRIANTNIEDSETVLHGILEGVLPAARRFEFRAGTDFIRGKVAKDITEDYLRTLETAPIVGRTITGTFIKRTVFDNTGAERVSFTLVKVVPDEGAPSHVL